LGRLLLTLWFKQVVTVQELSVHVFTYHLWRVFIIIIIIIIIIYKKNHDHDINSEVWWFCCRLKFRYCPLWQSFSYKLKF
ncbi:MAG: hypothetical protein N7Q72_03775, partial [Spiroplasma sp. Tabriz.8]|nr:hypothetical protein [Spiroplasma sp. Tabriz.8]